MAKTSNKIQLSYIEMHIPFFFCGVNFKDKIDLTQRPVAMVYDRDLGELHAIVNGRATIVPMSTVAHMEPADPEAAGIDLSVKPLEMKRPKPQVALATGPIRAQVSAPNGIKV